MVIRLGGMASLKQQLAETTAMRAPVPAGGLLGAGLLGLLSLSLPQRSGAFGPNPAIPTVVQDLTGCWKMGASNGRTPDPGCGVAPLDSGDGLFYLAQSPGGGITACLSQFCYRPAIGQLTNTSSGAGMLQIHTLVDKGNCTRNATGHAGFPTDGLLEHFNWVLPVGWPTHGNRTEGTNVAAADLSGVFVNNGNAAGVAGGIFLRRLVGSAACDHMRRLADCTAVPGAEAVEPAGDTVAAAALIALAPPQATPCQATLTADCGGERGAGKACMACLEAPAHHADIRRAGCTPPDVTAFCGNAPAPGPPPPPPPGPQTGHNATGCYLFGGSAGRQPGPGCGMAPARANGHAYVAHQQNGSVKVCLNQFCSRLLHGTVSTSSNGVGFMITETEFGVGNCTHNHSAKFPAAGLFAHIDFLLPAGWPTSGRKTHGTATNGTRTLTGMFINNGPALAGFLKMDPDIDQASCDHMAQMPFCSFVPVVGR
jgi:hypothetical protein